MTDRITKIKQWFDKAIVDREASKSVQLGCHFEEILEGLDCLDPEHASEGVEGAFVHAGDALSDISRYLKTGGAFQVSDREEFLDALVDMSVTAIGTAYMLGMDIETAFDRVIESLYSKFENGKALFDENGKIKKGKDFKKPDLSDLV